MHQEKGGAWVAMWKFNQRMKRSRAKDIIC